MNPRPLSALDIDEIRRRLGNVSRTHVFELFRTGALASFKIGKRRVATDTAVSRFLEAREREAGQ